MEFDGAYWDNPQENFSSLMWEEKIDKKKAKD